MSGYRDYDPDYDNRFDDYSRDDDGIDLDELAEALTNVKRELEELQQAYDGDGSYLTPADPHPWGCLNARVKDVWCLNADTAREVLEQVQRVVYTNVDGKPSLRIELDDVAHMRKVLDAIDSILNNEGLKPLAL